MHRDCLVQRPLSAVQYHVTAVVDFVLRIQPKCYLYPPVRRNVYLSLTPPFFFYELPKYSVHFYIYHHGLAQVEMQS